MPLENNPPLPLSLLIVEDDKAAIDILAVMIPIKFPDATVHLAYDGEMGLGVFKEQLPDIVITDINMPKMDGVAMAREMKAIKPATKIIVVTAYSDRIHLDKFEDIGIGEHILKPVQFQTLFSAIQRMVEEIRLERR